MFPARSGPNIMRDVQRGQRGRSIAVSDEPMEK
jgi:hypothetical protein